jgi:transposase
MAAAKRALRTLARRTQSLEQEIELLLTAAADHPERFRSDTGIAALCGVSPLPASSGKSKRHRLNRGGNRQANAALHRVAVVRLRWHEQTQAYAARRTEQGLSKSEILRCLKRFIAREVYRILLGSPPTRTRGA